MKITIQRNQVVTCEQVQEICTDCESASIQLERLLLSLDKVIPCESDIRCQSLKESLLRRYFEVLATQLKVAAFDLKSAMQGTEQDIQALKEKAKNAQRLGFFAHFLLIVIESITVKSLDPDIQDSTKELCAEFKKTLLAVSGLLHNISVIFRHNKLEERKVA